MTSPSYKVFVSSSGNIFMTEVAEAIAESIEATGREVSRHSSGLPKAEPGTINLVVSPHEYFLLLEGHTEADIVRAASESITIGVEQPGTSWFEVGARYASYGQVAVDINRRGVRELRRRGVETYHLPFGYHPGWDTWGGDESAGRNVDVTFLGALTTRRAAFLARSARVLAEWHCDLRVFEVRGPVTKSTGHFLTGRTKHELLAKSRVLVNVHQGDRDYFEWVRIIEAMSNGCLVVSETSGGFAPLRPSEHFIESGLDSLAGRVSAILHDEALRAELAQRAYDFVRKHLTLADSLDQVLSTIERRVAIPVQRAQPEKSTTLLPAAFEQSGRRRPISSAFAPRYRSGDVISVLDGERQIRSAIKKLVLAEVQEMRTIEALMSRLVHGEPTYADVFDTSSYAGVEPEVSIVITLFDYAHFVLEAIESVVASEGVLAELIVVDDHSSDNSVAVVRQAMATFDWFPIRLVAQAANRGPSPTRNRGFEHARADLVFVLDADNAIYPYALRTLVSALEGSDAAFAYGVLEVFGDRSGLLSYLPWNVERLVRENYIDVMALVRKSAWEEIGGFDAVADRVGGLDDYDFWLHLAAEGKRGVFVGEFIGRYREHGSSWQTTVNLDTDALTALFQQKYPHLPWV